MKNGNIFQELEFAEKDMEVNWDTYFQMEWEMKKNLKESKRIIKEEYELILKAKEKEILENYIKLLKVGRIIHDYSSFYASSGLDILKIVSVLLSYIEGERYIPYTSVKASQNSIVIKEEVSKQFDDMDYDTLERLYKSGDLIMLDSGFGNGIDLYNYIGEQNYSFGSFDYLQEFVNKLTLYRIDNDKKDIALKDLYVFMRIFLSTNPDLIQKNKDKRKKMLTIQSDEDSLIAECIKLEKELKR